MLFLARLLARLILILALVSTNAAAQERQPSAVDKQGLLTGAALIGGGLGIMAASLVDECRRTGGEPAVICRDRSPELAVGGLMISILGSGVLAKSAMPSASRKQLLGIGAALVGGGLGLTALGFGDTCTYEYKSWGTTYQSCQTRSEGVGWGGLTVATLGSVMLANGVQRKTLFDHLELKDVVSITEVDGRRTEGRITELTPSSLTVAVTDVDRRTFPVATLRNITVKDSVWNGALIGLVAGTVPATLFWTAFLDYAQHDLDGGRCDEKHRCQNPFPVGLGAGLITGGLPGLAIGAGIDAAIHRTIDVSRPRATEVTVSPVIGPSRQAVMVSVRF